MDARVSPGNFGAARAFQRRGHSEHGCSTAGHPRGDGAVRRARAPPRPAGRHHARRPGRGGRRRAGRLPRAVPPLGQPGRYLEPARLRARQRGERVPVGAAPQVAWHRRPVHRAARGVRGGARPGERGVPGGGGRDQAAAGPAARGAAAALLPRHDRGRDRAGHGGQPRHGQVRHVPRARRDRANPQGGVMTPAERVVRAATRAYGETVTELRPLDLTAAAKPGERHVRPRRRRRFPGWLAPVAAAAAVVALAISLVIVRNIPARPAPASGGVPRYYAALVPQPPQGFQNKLTVGDALTGARLATLTPARGYSFSVVT